MSRLQVPSAHDSYLSPRVYCSGIWNAIGLGTPSLQLSGWHTLLSAFGELTWGPGNILRAFFSAVLFKAILALDGVPIVGHCAQGRRFHPCCVCWSSGPDPWDSGNYGNAPSRNTALYRFLGAAIDTGHWRPVPSTVSFRCSRTCSRRWLIKAGTEVVNSLNMQRNALDAFLKACIGLEGSSDLLLETRIW
ncbi:hypothetical protein ARMGADRAFT_1032771 [Armillaria gallica]|uniref:Uncharacterized protein n=1 Tax=Armillaria gallica TaxID=47427 RepID=A0A2H3DMC0_ARMGA|nr:hypothetical protein ARMGADRAFT_1032771 [Armillaria gallica]